MIQATCRGCGQQPKVKCPRCGDPMELSGSLERLAQSDSMQPSPPVRAEPPLEAAFDFNQPAVVPPITCPACAASFTPAEDLRGKKAHCLNCGQALIVTSGGVAKRDEAPLAAAPPLTLRNGPVVLMLGGLGLLLLAGVVTVIGLLLRGDKPAPEHAAASPPPKQPPAERNAREAPPQQDNNLLPWRDEGTLKKENGSLKGEIELLKKKIDTLKETGGRTSPIGRYQLLTYTPGNVTFGLYLLDTTTGRVWHNRENTTKWFPEIEPPK